MKKIIEDKFKKAKTMIKIAIVIGVIWIIGFEFIIMFSGYKYDQTGILFLGFVVLTYATIILWIMCGVSYFPLKRSIAILNQDIEYYLRGVNEKVLLPKGKVYCGENALVVKKTGVIIPYEKILWMYKHRMSLYGVIPILSNIWIHTYERKTFSVKISDDELVWFLKKFQHKLSPHLIIGYGSEEQKRYDEFSKNRAFIKPKERNDFAGNRNNEKYCRYCGLKLPMSAEFCGECGAKQLEYDNENLSTDSYSHIDYGYVYNDDQKTNMTSKKRGWKTVGIIATVILVILFFVGIGASIEEAKKDEAERKNQEIVKDLGNRIDSLADDEEQEYKRGILTDTTFESEFIGIKYDAPSDWMLYPEEKLDESMEMMAIGDGEFGFDTVFVSVQELPSRDISEIIYMDNVKQRLKNYDSMEVVDNKTIAGKEYHSLLCKNVKEATVIYCRKKNDYMVSVIITINADSSRTFDEVTGCFSEYSKG